MTNYQIFRLANTSIKGTVVTASRAGHLLTRILSFFKLWVQSTVTETFDGLQSIQGPDFDLLDPLEYSAIPREVRTTNQTLTIKTVANQATNADTSQTATSSQTGHASGSLRRGCQSLSSERITLPRIGQLSISP